jgi:transcriptional regulator with XRE-family HTH domain
MTIGKKIRELRKEKEWRQKRLEEEVGVTENMVSLWELDKYDPSIFNCIVLADVFKVTLDELCCREVR